MSLHNFMEKLREAQLPSTGEAFRAPAGYLLGWGTTVGNGVEGWAPGALFIDVDASNPNNVWINEGSVTTAAWTAITLGQIGGTTTSAADSLAIPVTHAIVVKTTGADAEALTLADGAPGQVLTITLGTDGGGTGTLTPTTTTGWVSCAFADAGDTLSLKYVDDTVGWVILGTAGVAAPPAIALS